MITPTPEQVENSLRWWIAVGSGLDPKYCQPANSGKPAPNDPYATLLFVGDLQRGKPVQRRVLDADGNIVEKTQAVVRGRYSVQWFRDGAADMSARLRVWAYSSAGRYLATSGLPVGPVDPPTKVYHGLPCRDDGEKTPFAPFAMMRLTDPVRIDAVISGDEEPRYTSTLDVQYIQTLSDTIQRFVGADIILSDGESPEVHISVTGP